MSTTAVKSFTPRMAYWVFGAAGVVALAWGATAIIRAAVSPYATVSVKTDASAAPVELFGAQFVGGNAVQLSFPKPDASPLLNGLLLAQPIVELIVVLFGIYFAYRFTRRVVAGTPFGTSAQWDVTWIAIAVVAYPACSNFIAILAANTAARDLDRIHDFTAATNDSLFWFAIVICFLLQLIIYALIRGSKLERDTEGLI
jgi:hypothetical protein